MCTSRPAKVRMSDFGHSDKTVTFVGGLSNIDPMVEQCAATVQLRISAVLVGLIDVEVQPSEQLNAQEKFSQRSKYHFSKSARTQLKDFSELTWPTLLDLGHAT